MTSPGRVTARDQLPEQTQGTLDWERLETEAGTGRGEVVLHLKRVCSSSTWLPELLGPGEQHKTQAQLSLCHCGVPENLNLSGLDLGSACNSGPAPCRATWSLSSVDGESTHARSGANPVWPRHCERSPHSPVRFVCSVPPSPQHK